MYINERTNVSTGNSCVRGVYKMVGGGLQGGLAILTNKTLPMEYIPAKCRCKEGILYGGEQ